jgi:hypothetical protein
VSHAAADRLHAIEERLKARRPPRGGVFKPPEIAVETGEAPAARAERRAAAIAAPILERVAAKVDTGFASQPAQMKDLEPANRFTRFATGSKARFVNHARRSIRRSGAISARPASLARNRLPRSRRTGSFLAGVLHRQPARRRGGAGAKRVDLAESLCYIAAPSDGPR